MRPPDPVEVLKLFPEERAQLLHLLTGLRPDQWALPTVCPGWSVKDIALHLLGDDLGRLSRGRDQFLSPVQPEADETIVEFVNRLNELWVTATRRLGPRVLCDLLRVTGEWMLEYFGTLDLNALGGPVSWSGPEPAPVWLDVAREYTERWHHHQQIRDALGAPGLFETRLFAPVLATFVRALPHTFRNVDAADGSTVHLRITGQAGGEWSISRKTVGAGGRVTWNQARAGA